MCRVYNGYHGTSEIEHGLCACTVDNLLAKGRGLSLRTGAQTMLYLSLNQIRYPLNDKWADPTPRDSINGLNFEHVVYCDTFSSFLFLK